MTYDITSYRNFTHQITIQNLPTTDMYELDRRMFSLGYKSPADFICRAMLCTTDTYKFEIYIHNNDMLNDQKFKELMVEYLI